ncbi:peptidylprolyl isomerase [Desulfoplanes sp.]
MRWITTLLLVLMPFSVVASDTPLVELETTKGTIVLELDTKNAPHTVDNFLGYVDSGFYKGTIFHRVIENFMIQGGGMDKGMRPKKTGAPIKNEGRNGLENTKYTVAMARTNSPHSATSQFFINTADNGFLDTRGAKWGYTVFGRVHRGADVVDAIEEVVTTTRQGYKDVPARPVVILDARVIEE